MKLRLLTTIALIIALVPMAGAARADAPELIVVRSIYNDTSPPLREILIPAPTMKSGFIGDINPIQPSPQYLDSRGSDQPLSTDIQLQEQPVVPLVPTRPPFLDFLGLTNAQNPGFLSPPDVEGDVGPNHYMQWVNLIWAVWDKSGNLLSGPNLGNSFWQGFGGGCQNTNSGDPIVLHDDAADRWMVSQFVASGANAGAQCIAVSTSPDPLGSYNRYLFQVEPGFLNDYPKLGVWHETATEAAGGVPSQSAYTYTERNFSAAAGFNNYGVFERDEMLAGNPATLVLFRNQCVVGDCLEGGLPPHLDGPSVPFGTCPTFFNIVDDETDNSPWTVDGVRNHTLCVDWGTPGNSTLVENTIVAGDEIDRTDGNGFSSCVNTPGTNLDCLAIFTMFRAQVRNLGTQLSVVLNSTVDSGANRSGIYWLEMRDSLVSPNQNWTMRQDSIYSPNDGLERWMGSIAQNGQGDIYLGYTVANNATNPAIRYNSRASGDPLGMLPGGELVCRAGASAQVGSNRWGDYSTMSIDPTDDCSFWFTHEYSDTPNINWQTRVCAMDPCSPPPAGPTITQTGGSCPGTVNISGSNFTPNTEIPLVGAANLNGFVKAGVNCNGAVFEIGEPFNLPPTFAFSDGNGDFSVALTTIAGRCFVESLDQLGTCQTSNAIDTSP